jgi:hypothetical protein
MVCFKVAKSLTRSFFGKACHIFDIGVVKHTCGNSSRFDEEGVDLEFVV